jgi:hypothetical protein
MTSKPSSAVDCIAPAFAQTKRQLFSPFRLQRWTRLALVCLLTGEFTGGGGGYSGRFNFPATRPRGRKFLPAVPHVHWGKILPYLPWIVAGAALLFLLLLLWIYVASVYRFVLFDSVLYDRYELRGSWRRWEPAGRSYFCWCISIFVVSVVGLALLVGTPLLIAWRAGLFHQARAHLLALILGGVALLFLLIAFFVLDAVAALLAKDFCLPIMAMENVGVLRAWGRLFPMLATEKVAFAGYVLMKIVLALGSAIVFGTATFMALIVLLIPLGIVGVIVFIVGKAIGLGLNAASVSILVAVGGVILAGFLYLVALINTPAMVFFQSYMLHFFGSRYPALGAVVFPEPPVTPPSADLGTSPTIEPAIG